MRIGYARVSTDDQNLDLQLSALGSNNCDKIFSDHGMSGSRFDRPGLREALALAKSGDVLVVWRLDRLGRSLSHLVEIILSLGRRGIKFVSLMESIDTNSPTGMLMFHLIAALAEFERSLISERTRAGMAAAKNRGVRLGRPKKNSAIHPISGNSFRPLSTKRNGLTLNIVNANGFPHSIRLRDPTGLGHEFSEYGNFYRNAGKNSCGRSKKEGCQCRS